MDSASENLLNEALRIVSEADQRGIQVRLSGSIAIRNHCQRLGQLLDTLGREPYRDIDLIGFSKQQSAIAQLLMQLGYAQDPRLIASQEYGIRRLVFYGFGESIKLDVFLDTVPMSHTLSYLGRLQLDKPTVPVIDLLLSKLQIHEITAKDLTDSIVLLAEHEIAKGSPDAIDPEYAQQLVSRDWGLHKTVTANLALLRRVITSDDRLDEYVRVVVTSRIDRLTELVEIVPKSIQWRLRAKLGIRVRWYEDVGEFDR